MSGEGDPDLRLGGLSLWIHDREFPGKTDFWDGNWLKISARMEATGSRVEVHGPLIRTSELAAFSEELKKLYPRLEGSAELSCLEPGLNLLLQARSLGQVAVKVEITPDQLSQAHRFEFSLDQTYLAPLLAACQAALERFPIRGSADRE